MDSVDATWYTWLTGVWALVEMDFGIIVACMPAAAAFFRGMGHSSWFTTFKGLTSWRKMTGNGQEKSGYAMEDHENTFGHHAGSQGRSCRKSYGLSALDAMVPIEDSESARNLRGDGF
jgi:hypothetical protein